MTLMALERRKRSEIVVDLDLKNHTGKADGKEHEAYILKVLEVLSRIVSTSQLSTRQRWVQQWLKSDAAERWASELLIEYFFLGKCRTSPLLYAIPSDPADFGVYATIRVFELLLDNAEKTYLHRNQRHRPLGIHFNLCSRDNGAQNVAALHSASSNVQRFRSKKRQDVHSFLDHQQPYKPYTEVRTSTVRSCLIKVAHSFLDLDELFAAMFVQVIEASDWSILSETLKQIRREVFRRQTGDSSDDVARNAYIGHLGQHCEDLLKYYEHARDQTLGVDAANVPEFRSSNGSLQSLMEYLEDGFETPYWKVMLEAFSTFRSYETTLGGNLISMSLIGMRSKIYDLRRQLQKTIDMVYGEEDISPIVVAIDKRIKLLHDFADRAISEGVECDDIFDTLLIMPKINRKKLDVVNAGKITTASVRRTGEDNSPKSEPLLLVTLVLLTLLAATVPFTLGFKASNETGTVSDADFWFNISSSIFAIMANFVMIVQLTKGSRFTNEYKFVWLWFSLGIICAIVSVAVYPFCNTAWSSLLSFFATIAGFGATLSVHVAMTVGSSQSGLQPAIEEGKKKTD